MTTKEAAEMLGLDFTSISRLLRKGILKGQKFGRDWMVYRDSVEAYLEKYGKMSKTDPRRGQSED